MNATQTYRRQAELLEELIGWDEATEQLEGYLTNLTLEQLMARTPEAASVTLKRIEASVDTGNESNRVS